MVNIDINHWRIQGVLPDPPTKRDPISGNNKYTFETFCQVLTSIDTTRLTPVAHYSLFTVNLLFLIAFYLQLYVAHC